MKHLWKGAVALSLFGAVAALSAGGCVETRSSFYIESVVAQSCDPVTPESDRTAIGTIDVKYQCEYLAWLVIGNQLVRRGDDNKLQTETSRIQLTAIDVQILDAGGNRIVTDSGGGAFTLPVDGFVDPSDDTEPGLGLTAGILVDGGTGQYLAETGYSGIIVARIVAHGVTLGGDAVQTPEWDFPIRVVSGDLCSEPADDECVNADSAPTDACLIAQDQQFDCRFIGVNCSAPARCGKPL